MHQFRITRCSTEDSVARFLDEHGAGLDEMFRAFHGDPDLCVTHDILRATRDRIGPDAGSARAVLEDAVSTLLDYVGESFPVPSGFRSEEYDTALRWYAARLTDLRNAL